MLLAMSLEFISPDGCLIVKKPRDGPAAGSARPGTRFRRASHWSSRMASRAHGGQASVPPKGTCK
jgi:hypothetical protein